MLTKIKSDYTGNLKDIPSTSNLAIGFFKSSGFRTLTLYRAAHILRANKLNLASAILTRAIRLNAPIDIEVSAEIGEGLSLPHPICIVIGGAVKIGKNCKIMQGVTIGGSLGKKLKNGQSQPIIGDNVFIAAGAKIIGPVTIGDNVVIGANSVITKDIPAGSIAYGIPAKIINNPKLVNIDK